MPSTLSQHTVHRGAQRLLNVIGCTIGLILSASALGTDDAAADLDRRHPGATVFVEEIVARHAIERAEVTALLAQAERRQAILDAIARPAEGKPWRDYRPIFITEKRVQEGVAFWQSHAQLLQSATEVYGVPIEIVVAIIGIETNYGRVTGGHRVLDALATLAFHYPPRARFFREQLEHYLILGQEEGLPLSEIEGSYAGAMGLGQFIASSYRSYAVDFDADGRRDLWGSKPDAIASVANYMKRHGWQLGAPIASRAQRSQHARVLQELALKPTYPVAQLREWGYTPVTPTTDQQLATIIELDGDDGPEQWLGYHNFYVITRYNHSALYAMAVYQLSVAIAERVAPLAGR